MSCRLWENPTMVEWSFTEHKAYSFINFEPNFWINYQSGMQLWQAYYAWDRRDNILLKHIHIVSSLKWIAVSKIEDHVLAQIMEDQWWRCCY